VTTECTDEAISEQLAELGSMPSLRTLLNPPAMCAERAVDAEALYGLTELTTLSFYERRQPEEDEDSGLVDVAGEWVLDLSRLR